MEEMKLSLSTNDMLKYIDNPIDSTKKLLDLMNEFGKTAGCSVNIQKSKAFLYSNKEISGTEIRNKTVTRGEVGGDNGEKRVKGFQEQL